MMEVLGPGSDIAALTGQISADISRSWGRTRGDDSGSRWFLEWRLVGVWKEEGRRKKTQSNIITLDILLHLSLSLVRDVQGDRSGSHARCVYMYASFMILKVCPGSCLNIFRCVLGVSVSVRGRQIRWFWGQSQCLGSGRRLSKFLEKVG
jgi:hypothetical protein